MWRYNVFNAIKCSTKPSKFSRSQQEFNTKFFNLFHFLKPNGKISTLHIKRGLNLPMLLTIPLNLAISQVCQTQLPLMSLPFACPKVIGKHLANQSCNAPLFALNGHIDRNFKSNSNRIWTIWWNSKVIILKSCFCCVPQEICSKS